MDKIDRDERTATISNVYHNLLPSSYWKRIPERVEGKDSWINSIEEQLSETVEGVEDYYS
jgi:hypothetical protein